MDQTTYRVYPYRWVILAVFMFINATLQMLWICYSPITGPAAAYYGVSDLAIGFLSMLFMIAYLPLAVPVSWVIDRWGYHRAVALGAVIIAVSGLLRGVAGTNWTLVLLGTIGLSVAQPFLLNAWTTMPARWFDTGFRATAVGLVTLASLAGTAAGMVLTPVLTQSMSIARVQLLYGAVTALSCLLFLLLDREAPPTPPAAPLEGPRALMLDGLRNALQNRMFWMFLVITFITMGIFNGITTWIEPIIRPRGFSPEQAGTLGGLLLAGGVLGAIVLPAFSDHERRRRRWLIVGVAGSMPGLLGLAVGRTMGALAASSFVLGFFITGLGPVGMQYAAEITRPTPEGTSNGLLQFAGQAAVVYVYIMEALRTRGGSFTLSLLVAELLLAGSLALALHLRDPELPAAPSELAPHSAPAES